MPAFLETQYFTKIWVYENKPKMSDRLQQCSK